MDRLVYSLKARGYRQKALFTKEIGNRPPYIPRSPYMTQITGICPYIPWFWGYIGLYGGYMGGLGVVWVQFTLVCSVLPIYSVLSI